MDVVYYLSSWMGSILVFGVSALIHAILLAGIFVTLGVFETAKRRPQYFGGLGRGNGGEMNDVQVTLAKGEYSDRQAYVHVLAHDKYAAQTVADGTHYVPAW